MATKASTAQAVQTKVRLELRGVEYDNHTHDSVTFEMPMVEAQLDYMALESILTDAGVPKEHAITYIEGFIHKVHTGELARAIAERMTRVG